MLKLVYHKVNLKIEDRQKAVFVTTDGLDEFYVTSLGFAILLINFELTENGHKSLGFSTK